MTDAGLESLNWLADLHRADAGHFVPIGSNGFYQKGGERARFDRNLLRHKQWYRLVSKHSELPETNFGKESSPSIRMVPRT